MPPGLPQPDRRAPRRGQADPDVRLAPAGPGQERIWAGPTPPPAAAQPGERAPRSARPRAGGGGAVRPRAVAALGAAPAAATSSRSGTSGGPRTGSASAGGRSSTSHGARGSGTARGLSPRAGQTGRPRATGSARPDRTERPDGPRSGPARAGARRSAPHVAGAGPGPPARYQAGRRAPAAAAQDRWVGNVAAPAPARSPSATARSAPRRCRPAGTPTAGTRRSASPSRSGHGTTGPANGRMTTPSRPRAGRKARQYLRSRRAKCEVDKAIPGCRPSTPASRDRHRGPERRRHRHARHKEHLVDRAEAAYGAYERNRFQDALRAIKPVADEAPGWPRARAGRPRRLPLRPLRSAAGHLEAFGRFERLDRHMPVLMDCQRALHKPKKVAALWAELRQSSPSLTCSPRGGLWPRPSWPTPATSTARSPCCPPQGREGPAKPLGAARPPVVPAGGPVRAGGGCPRRASTSSACSQRPRGLRRGRAPPGPGPPAPWPCAPGAEGRPAPTSTKLGPSRAPRGLIAPRKKAKLQLRVSNRS